MPKKYLFPLTLLSILMFLWQCSSEPSPREAVLDFLEAVHNSDTTTIMSVADLDKMAQEKLSNLPAEQKEKLIPVMRNNLLSNLVDNGATRIWWENALNVVAGEKIWKDTAEVEVTFIDQKSGIKHYTKMKLYFKDNRWRVYYFED